MIILHFTFNQCDFFMLSLISFDCDQNQLYSWIVCIFVIYQIIKIHISFINFNFFYWVYNSWKLIIFFWIILKTTKIRISLQFIYYLYSWANLVIIMLKYQISDLACQIDMWFWNQIMISIQLIMFVDASIISWSWNVADSYDLSKFSWKTLIFWILIVIVQNIILL